MKKLKHNMAILLTAIVIVFTFQNTAQAEYVLLDAKFEVPRAFILIVVFFVGAFGGAVIAQKKSHWGI